jgi:hypothetical protein
VGTTDMITTFAALALLQATPAESAPGDAQPPAKPAGPCESVDHRAFDFWIGEWDVFTIGSDKKAGESRIEAMSGGCAIRETWMPVAGPGGTSISLVNHRTGRWEQMWIGGDGRRVDFTGGRTNAIMVLTGYWDDVGGPDQDALVRIIWREETDGAVRQKGEYSTNDGVTWGAFFDYTYKPIAGE